MANQKMKTAFSDAAKDTFTCMMIGIAIHNPYKPVSGH
jgi:hypothetical protein